MLKCMDRKVSPTYVPYHATISLLILFVHVNLTHVYAKFNVNFTPINKIVHNTLYLEGLMDSKKSIISNRHAYYHAFFLHTTGVNIRSYSESIMEVIH